jgi:glycosyltransferase involved in cell wall biosynthesis
MRVIHLLQSSRFSGAENVVCQIFSFLKNEKDIEMLYCSRDGQVREALAERGISFIPIQDISEKEVKRVIGEYQPDIIHAHDMRASYIAVRVCGKIPVITHIHNNNFDSRGLSAKSIAYLYAGIKAKHIFWVSDSSFNGYVFHNMLKSKSEVLYNIISIDDLYKKMALDSNTYDYDVVYLGRLTTQKNPSRLLKVFRLLIDKKPDIKIAVIGTGELENEVHEEANELHLGENVSFLGFQSNPYKMLHDAKLMIMTSLWEGTPMCVLEAMSLGVPVVSTPTDGVKVVIENKKSGFLSDDDAELVDYCLNLINDSELHKKCSENSIQRAHELMDEKAYKDRILKIYRKIEDR